MLLEGAKKKLEQDMQAGGEDKPPATPTSLDDPMREKIQELRLELQDLLDFIDAEEGEPSR